MIGLTSAIQDPEGAINFGSIADATVWRRFMTPGRFFLTRQIGQFDMYISSGYFPIEPGQRQRMAISVAMAGGGLTVQNDLASAIKKQQQARTAFESDYQFAQAPIQPTLTAVPGDRKVTLYWDDLSEESEDRFIKRLGGNSKDFEGYRIYRATDSAFLDALTITDGTGIPTLLRPIAQFDLDDGISGFHPIDINGVKYDLGTDSGLRHSFVDTSLAVVNGQRYFYAVTAYDFGFESGNISPTETAIKLNISPDGEIESLGTNVAVVRPRAPVAGYLPAGVTAVEHAEGTSNGIVGFEIVDPRIIEEGHTYEITFEDTLIQGRIFSNAVTKNFTVEDLDDGIELFKSTLINEGDEVPLIDGIRLHLVNEARVSFNDALSRWSSNDIFSFQFSRVQFLSIIGEEKPNDYRVVFGEPGLGSAKDTTISFLRLPAKEVNFQVVNAISGQPVIFAFAEVDGTDGRFTINPDDANRTDTIYLLERNDANRLVYTWQITLNTIPRTGRNPQAGDTMHVFLRKPFLRQDIYRFTVHGEGADSESARSALNNIRVVPNPYVAAASWEPRNTFTSGRGARELHFVNLPQNCTIKIFNVNGVLIDEIEHQSSLDNGTAIWDLLSRDNLEISYGLYIYHIEAPGVGEKTGNFAVIK
jgi:hypothetical protein